MKSSDFDYHLPEELIAQVPTARRDESRLLVVDRTTRTISHQRFSDLPGYLRSGDTLIRNTARVLPARLFGTRATGGKVECLLLRNGHDLDVELSDGQSARLGPPENLPGHVLRSAWAKGEDQVPPKKELWWCLLKPGRKLSNGSVFGAAGDFEARVVSKSDTAEYLVEITPANPDESVAMLAERIGIIPLPPYIHRSHGGANIQPEDAVDRNRYQTVFADQKHTVAVAAPTAGLHFTEPLLNQIGGLGVGFADVVLHVGLGTFRPIETEEISEHPIHREIIEVPPKALRLIHHRPNGRRIAVGTTSVRTMEYVAKKEPADTNATGTFVGEADLFIYPPYSFRAVEALITNFHLPRSTLLCLVAAFLAPGSTDGVAWLREIYSEAIRERYRFLSYGDAMLIV